MRMVSKSQFKAQALEYLRDVEQSKKSLLVTHMGKPVIKITPYNEDVTDVLKQLQKSVISYKDPYKPVGEDEWEALS